MARSRSHDVYNGVVVVVVVFCNDETDAYCFPVIIILSLPEEEDLLSSFCTCVMKLWSFLSSPSVMLLCFRNRGVPRCGTVWSGLVQDGRTEDVMSRCVWHVLVGARPNNLTK